MRTLLLAAAALLALPALGAGDPAQGEKLVAEKKCEACHRTKTPADAKAIYLRKNRTVTSLAKLKSQVAACNSALDLQLFPEDEEHIVAYLDRAYYKFSTGK